MIPALTEIEKLVIDLVYRQGMSIKQAAYHRSRGAKTIEEQLRKARRKLGAKTGYQLGYIVGQLSTKDPS